jgi:hypothetical protein
MERHRRRPTDMPVAALAVAVAARFALQVIPPESLLVEKWNVVVVTHLQHMQTKWWFSFQVEALLEKSWIYQQQWK